MNPKTCVIPDDLPEGFRLGYDGEQARRDWNAYDERSVHMIGSLTASNDYDGWGPVLAAGLAYHEFPEELPSVIPQLACITPAPAA